MSRRLHAPDQVSFEYVLETLRLVRQELDGSLPALVFAGAPFTLASYQIGTGKDLAKTRAFIRENPKVLAIAP
ncbi:MAG: uroporphyrinogen decarboxylase family protein [Planctomycetota bacterium]